MKIEPSIYQRQGILDSEDVKEKSTKTSITTEDQSLTSKDAKTNSSSVDITTTAKNLYKLQEEILNAPEVDKSKVQNALKKIQNGELGILGDAEDRLAAAERIASRLLDIESKM